MARKLIHLTVDEAQARDRAIEFYRYVGKPDAEVMSLAWIDVQLAFPRLQAFDGEQAGE